MSKLDMNPEIRQQWCKALRSDDYTQTQNNLRTRNVNGTYSHCCLGVLTDLYVKAGKPEEYREGREIFNVWETGTLAEPVMEWAGIDDTNPVLMDTGPQGCASSMAAEWNDTYGAGFNMIADMIDGGEGKQG